MAFIAPLLVIYELAGVVLGPTALRNGADTWLRGVLESIGFGQYFLLPILTCSILLAWHHTRQDSWQLQGGVLTTMLLESTLFALVLFGLAHLQRALLLRRRLRRSRARARRPRCWPRPVAWSGIAARESTRSCCFG